ncbi:MAG: GNAT family N-acetyltransferase [Candidatus Hydrogenedentota bacterium]
MEGLIETERLLLIPLNLEVHRAFLAGDIEQANEELNVSGLTELSLPRFVWELRHGQLEENPDHSPWLLRAMVLKDTRQVVGNIGFHGTPEMQANIIEEFGAIEFGYSVIEGFRRNRYTKEACEGLMSWATDVADTPNFILSIAPKKRSLHRHRTKPRIHQALGI